MKKLGASLAILIAAGAGSAYAADLPTKKAPAPAPVNCYASLWTWLNSSAADCPISYGGITLYATIDAGVGYELNGAGYNQWWNNGVSNIITKQSTHGPQWLWTPNGLSQSVVGVKMSEPIGSTGWSLVGAAETGFNPYGINLAYAQKGQVQNNGQSLFLQSAQANSSRTGQPLNSQWFLGFSNPTYGTLTGGRVNTLSLDAINSYDPMGGSYAFSPIGYSGSYAGFGDTEAARANTALKYRVNIQNFRLGGLVQVGGYDWGNGTNGMYQGQIGGDFNFPSGGVLSIDGTASYAKDAVNLATAGSLTQCSTLTKGPFAGQTGCTNSIPGIYTGLYNQSDFVATLSNNLGLMVNTKYKWQAWTFYASYQYFRQQNPSDAYPNGFETIGYFNVPGTIPGFNVPGSAASKLKLTTQWAVNNNYNIPRVANVFWVGAKYSVPDDWMHGWGSADLTGAFYCLGQNDYNYSVSTTSRRRHHARGLHQRPSQAVSSRTDRPSPSRASAAASAPARPTSSPSLIDWRPVKRMDVYAGVMISNVYAGLANGYYATQTINPTAGIRIKF